MHPREIENGSNPSNWMIGGHYLIKPKLIEELSLVVIEPKSSIASIANRIGVHRITPHGLRQQLFATWGNSGIEPDEGTGNQLSSNV
jgi:hypothetical protein